MSRLTRDGTAEPVSRDQILRHARGHGNINVPCSADHEQDWQPYPVDPYSAICDDHTCHVQNEWEENTHYIGFGWFWLWHVLHTVQCFCLLKFFLDFLRGV